MRRSYDTCLVICHGKSELIFIENIKSNLRLKFKTYAERNGNSSIQITGLNKLLRSRDFKTLSSFQNKYNIEVKKGIIESFKVFIVMDFDEPECSVEIKNNFLNKTMFKNHFLYDYIVPIFSDKNFDEIMLIAGFDIDVKNKVKSYANIFPGKNGGYKDFEEVKNKIDHVDSKKSNLKILLDYLMEVYKSKAKY